MNKYINTLQIRMVVKKNAQYKHNTVCLRSMFEISYNCLTVKKSEII